MVSPLPSEGVTQVLVALALVLIAAALGGRVAQRIGQPSVIGQVLAGVLLGPSVAGRVLSGPWDWVFSTEHGAEVVLPTIASFAAVLLLALAGLDFDPTAVRERGWKVGGLVVASLVPAMLGGFAVGWVLPESFVGDDTSRLGFALLVAIGLGISSPPVMSAVLRELKVAHRSFAHVALSVAMLNDVVGWVLLGAVVAGASGAAGALTKAGIGLALLAGLSAAVWVVLPRLGTPPATPAGQTSSWTVPALAVVLLFAAVTHSFGIEAVLGAFVAGIVLRRTGDGGRAIADGLRPAVTVVFAPVFFVVAGLRVDLRLLGSAEVLTWTVIVIAVASAAKVLGAGAAWRWAGRPKSESLAMGAILNVRGSLEIVLAGVGLAAGILNPTSYSVVVLMALATSAMATPLIRKAFGAEGLARRQQPLEPAPATGVSGG